jgi:hypothetical protein
MRSLTEGMKGEDVRLLHAVLNWHLPPPSDQLPTEGSEALYFGPRTLAKVKEFQKLKSDRHTRIQFSEWNSGP